VAQEKFRGSRGAARSLILDPPLDMNVFIAVDKRYREECVYHRRSED